MNLPILDIASADPCLGCGRCCLHVTSPPFCRINDPEWDRLVAERPDLAAAIDLDIDRRYGPGGEGDVEAPCLWLEPGTGRCLNYEHRPGICVDFEVGGEDCLRMRETGVTS